LDDNVGIFEVDPPFTQGFDLCPNKLNSGFVSLADEVVKVGLPIGSNEFDTISGGVAISLFAPLYDLGLPSIPLVITLCARVLPVLESVPRA